jgi:hypothetical protein
MPAGQRLWSLVNSPSFLPQVKPTRQKSWRENAHGLDTGSAEPLNPKGKGTAASPQESRASRYATPLARSVSARRRASS